MVVVKTFNTIPETTTDVTGRAAVRRVVVVCVAVAIAVAIAVSQLESAALSKTNATAKDVWVHSSLWLQEVTKAKTTWDVVSLGASLAQNVTQPSVVIGLRPQRVSPGPLLTVW